MKSHPKVSVVAISYNQENYIEQTLKSFVTQQTDFDFEVVIADDASKDKTQAIIRQYAKDYPKIIKPILRTKNVGVQPNLTEALQAASGDYIAICEGDDYWTDSKKLQKQADFLDKSPDYALVFHRATVFFEKGEKNDHVSPPEDEPINYTPTELLRRNFIPTNTVMYRKQNYDHVPQDIMPLDWYLHLLHAQFGKIGFINANMAACRRHSGGVWWDAHNDPDRLLASHGAGWLKLYLSFLSSFAKTPDQIEIVEGAIINLMKSFMAVDERHDSHLIEKMVELSPKSGVILIRELKKELDQFNGHSEEQAKIIKHYVDMSTHLKEVNLSLSAENAFLKSGIVNRVRHKIKKRIHKKS